MTKSNQSYCIEGLEERVLLTTVPTSWASKLIRQDVAVQNYPSIDGRGETIAVLDSGVDYSGASFGNGFGAGHKVIDGWDFVDNDSNPWPNTSGHGTGSAGVAAGLPFSSGGAIWEGVAPGANIVALREANNNQLKSALQWVINNRTKYNIVAINMVAWTTDLGTPVYQNEIQTLYRAGVFINAPVTNEGLGVGIQKPVAMAEVFGSAGVDSSDHVAAAAQRGSALDMLAPSENMAIPYHDENNNRFIIVTGTAGASWSSPQITGAATLIKQINSNFTPDQIMSILKDSGHQVYDGGTGRSYPRLDLAAALALAYQRSGQAPAPTPPPAPSVDAPFNANPFNIGDTIQVEQYDKGGEGVAYHDVDSGNSGGQYRGDGVDIEGTSDSGGGYDVGYTKAGEWALYQVNVSSSGTYNIDVRVAASGAGGAIHFNVDGNNATGSIAVPNTGGFQNWTTVTKTLTLSAGKHVIGLSYDANGSSGYVGNINWFKIYAQPAPAPAPTAETPYTGSPFSVNQQIEAEDFNLGGEGVSYHDVDSANNGGKFRTGGVDIEATTDSGGGYSVGYIKAGEWMDYQVTVPTTGTYTVQTRVASSGLGGTFHFTQDGVDKTGSIRIQNTGGFQNWTTVSKTINLTAGTHELGLVFDSNGASGYVGNVNWVKVATGQSPFYLAPVPGYIQAEDFDNGGEGVAYHDIETANLGGAYRTFDSADVEAFGNNQFALDYTKAGEWEEYTVNATASGTYTFSTSVASAGNGGTFHVEVDGANVTGSLAVINTGSYTSYGTVSKSGVSLSAGQHTVRLVMDSNGANGYVGNFDWLRFS